MNYKGRKKERERESERRKEKKKKKREGTGGIPGSNRSILGSILTYYYRLR